MTTMIMSYEIPRRTGYKTCTLRTYTCTLRHPASSMIAMIVVAAEADRLASSDGCDICTRSLWSNQVYNRYQHSTPTASRAHGLSRLGAEDLEERLLRQIDRSNPLHPALALLLILEVLHLALIVPCSRLANWQRRKVVA